MKKVEFVQVTSELCGYGLAKGSRYRFYEVEETIQQYIENSWDYNGYVPVQSEVLAI